MSLDQSSPTLAQPSKAPELTTLRSVSFSAEHAQLAAPSARCLRRDEVGCQGSCPGFEDPSGGAADWPVFPIRCRCWPCTDCTAVAHSLMSLPGTCWRCVCLE